MYTVVYFIPDTVYMTCNTNLILSRLGEHFRILTCYSTTAQVSISSTREQILVVDLRSR